MLLIGHTAIGIAVGSFIPNPIFAFLVGVLSHHIADYVPHFDVGSHYTPEELAAHPARKPTWREWTYVSIDILLTVAFVFALRADLVQYQFWSLAAGIFGANFPDIIHNVPFWNESLRKIAWNRWWQDKIHRRFQTTVPLNRWYYGVATQLITIALVLWLVGY